MSLLENKAIMNWIIALIVIFIASVSLAFIRYQDYLLVYGYVDTNYVNIYLTDAEITELTFKLKEDGEIKDYEILEVSNNYIVDQNQLKRNVKLSFDFESDNYILELYLEIGDKINIWQKVYKKYLKGVI
ncbi:MAG: hypothetical protein IJB71_03650 [Bacilli bacterium]|nr:hypothetical protein [Bacilli bacterium]